jgi:hypothetical protein
LNHLAEAIFAENAFPSGRPVDRFLGSGYTIGDQEYEILIDLGFGRPFSRKVILVYPTGSGNEPKGAGEPLIHKHIIYSWPPKTRGFANKIESQDYVFPAIISDLSDLEPCIEQHLLLLLESSSSMIGFPLWRSQLRVLRVIYMYYKNSRPVSPIRNSHGHCVKIKKLS